MQPVPPMQSGQLLDLLHLLGLLSHPIQLQQIVVLLLKRLQLHQQIPLHQLLIRQIRVQLRILLLV